MNGSAGVPSFPEPAPVPGFLGQFDPDPDAPATYADVRALAVELAEVKSMLAQVLAIAAGIGEVTAEFGPLLAGLTSGPMGKVLAKSLGLPAQD